MTDEQNVRAEMGISVLGYILIWTSALILLVATRLSTGYMPPFKGFVFPLVSFRLTEIHNFFLIAPLILAAITIKLLTRTWISRKVAGGIALTSYYILTSIIFFIKGAGEFSLEISSLWIVWVFVLGYASTVILERLKKRLLMIFLIILLFIIYPDISRIIVGKIETAYWNIKTR